MMKLLYHDNPVLRTLASLPVVYYEYISSQYAIKDPLCSRKYIHSFFISGTWPIESRTDRYIQKIDYTHTHIKTKT